MSIKAMTLVWDKFPGAGSELLVMLAFADWCNNNGESLHPSIPTVAKKIRASESQARRLIHGLIDQGWVSVIGNEYGGAPGNSRRYRLNIAKLAGTGSASATPSAGATPRISATPSTHATPRRDARDGSHGCAQTPSTHARRTTNRTTKETTTTPDDLNWDALPQITTEQRVVVVGQMEELDQACQQAALDELAGALRMKAIKGQWPGWFHRVIQKAIEGNFQPNHALAIQSERKLRAEAEQLAKQQRAEAEARSARLSDPEAKARSQANLKAIGALLRP